MPSYHVLENVSLHLLMEEGGRVRGMGVAEGKVQVMLPVIVVMSDKLFFLGCQSTATNFL